jgi:large subunit ribosomal protein L19
MKAQKYTKETIREIGVQNRQFPEFSIGDTVVVSQSIKEEAGKERLQAFEGDVIAIHKNGASSTFTVRKISHSVGVERIFPHNSPLIKDIKVLSKGDVRRAKLYYLRKKVGKAAHVKKRVETKKTAESKKVDQTTVAATE